MSGKNLLIKHISQLVTPTGDSMRCGAQMQEVKKIHDAAVFIENDTIRFVGTTAEVEQSLAQAGIKAETCMDASGKCVLPGFIDSHTHFIFAGYRPDEFMMRLSGAAYLDIMKAGGGIAATVIPTREASFDTLYELGKNRLSMMLAQGITTIEGKSGYGLDLDTELRQLSVMKSLDENEAIDIVPTYLGAHAVPQEAKSTQSYVDFMIEKVLPEVKCKDLAKFCDVFCEEGVFSAEESERLLTAAKEMGFDLKLHADEIHAIGGSEVAGKLHAVSADHLLHITDSGIQALRDNNVIATLLPGTAFSLHAPFAPARKIIDSGCAVALASDFNPGSCFISSIPLTIALSTIYMQMSLEETITALTLNGAAALGIAEKTGSIEPGKQADLTILSYDNVNFLVYHTAANIVDTVIKKGTIVYENTAPNA